MIMTSAQKTVNVPDNSQLEFYKLIGEGFQAMQEGRTSTIEEVRELLELRRKDSNR